MTIQAFHFLALITLLLSAFTSCFLVVAFGYSIDQCLKGESFRAAFVYFWDNF